MRRSGVKELTTQVRGSLLERRAFLFRQAADLQLEDVRGAKERVRRPLSLDLAVDEEGETITVLDEVGGHVRGEDDGGAARPSGAEQVSEDSEARRIESRGGLVEEDHLGVIQERLRQPKAAVHSPGVGPKRRLARVRQAHAAQHLLDAPTAIRASHAREGGDEIEHPPGGEFWREGGPVREEGEAAADRPGGGGVAQDLDPPRARPVHPGQQTEERRFPGAVRADDPQGLALLDAQINLVERLAAAPAQPATEGPAQPRGLDGGLGGLEERIKRGAGHGFLPGGRATAATIRRMARLFVLSGASIGATHDIDGTSVLGRGGDADVVIPEPSVSRLHARLIPEPDPGVWKIRDLKSSNGVHVGGKRVEEARVRDGETFLLGDVELRLRDEPEAEAPRSSAEASTATSPPELEFEDELVLPGAEAVPPAAPTPRGGDAPGPGRAPVSGGDDADADSVHLQAARARAAEERSARRAAALNGPAAAPPRGDRPGGGGQVLQYAQHRGGDDLNQLPGWKRFVLGLLAVGLALGVAYGAFELTRTAREQAAAIGD